MTSAESYNIFDNKSSLGKLVFLMVIAIALCSFTPLVLLAPVPIAIAFLLYGRLTAFGMGLASVGVLWLITTFLKIPVGVNAIYGVSFLYALLISEVIYRDVSPVKGILASGITLFALTMTIITAIHFSKPTLFKSELSAIVTKTFNQQKEQNKKLLDAGTEEAREMRALLDNPEKVVTEIYENTPAIVFVSVFLGIWLSFFVLLRNAKIWRYKVYYKFGIKDLLQFKVPEFLIWAFIVGLVSYLGADFGLGKTGEIVGTNILAGLSILYFFQGFGIYNDFLSFIKIGGLIRIILTTFTMIYAWKMLVVLGVFDLWFNFRKFLKKQNGEGDKI